jgi:eukaryotic-like serine/threonine-protein kinase
VRYLLSCMVVGEQGMPLRTLSAQLPGKEGYFAIMGSTNRIRPLIVAALLVVVLVVGGLLALGLALRSKTTGGSPASTTTPGLYRAQITATPRVSLTETASADLTATAQANSTATAVVFAANPDPYAAGGKLVLLDPLRDNSLGFAWDEGSFSDGGCTFSGGAYHVLSAKTQAFHYCVANYGIYHNFSFEAQVQVIKGDCGGLIFRADSSTSSLYLFEVCRDGSFSLYLYKGSAHSTLLAHGASPAIEPGLKQVDVLAVVAQGSTIALYANKKRIASVRDSSYSQGQIGLVADAFNDQTEVVFSNARLWTM